MALPAAARGVRTANTFGIGVVPEDDRRRHPAGRLGSDRSQPTPLEGAGPTALPMI